MTSITTWTRLEPRPRGDDLAPSLEGRIYDPGWLLGRQWQLGEFVGEDAGSPVDVRLELEATPLTALRAGSRVDALDPGPPLDARAGAEKRPSSTLTVRAEAGVELLDLLDDHGCSAEGAALLVGDRLLPTPPAERTTGAGRPHLALGAGRLPDGDALLPVVRQIASSGAVPAQLGIDSADHPAVVAAAIAWLRWRDEIVLAPAEDSWVDERLEHRFELAADPPAAAPFRLHAPAWTGDRLDWYDLDVDLTRPPPPRPPGASPPSPLPLVDPATGRVAASGVPAPLTYPGMPAARWWEFEEARVNFAEVQAEPEDLARMLIVEFSSVYGNDWYLWPLDLPVGAIHTVTRFEVTNTFGDLTSVESVPPRGTRAGRADWQLFRPTEKSRRRPRPHDGLLLLPTLASPRISEAVEEVRFLRDELANLAWAVEGTVTGEDGVALDRHAEAAAAGELNPAPAAGGGSDVDPLRYRFSTHVPPFWFPLAPDPAQPTIFRRLVVRRVDADGVVRTSLPAGEVLAPPDLWVWREEVPREGSRVRRRFQMARGSDGLLYVWGSRLRSTGMGEGYSGLRYDDALPIEDETP